MFKDFLGRGVEVNDYIFYSTTGRYAESRLCVITRFTAKTVFAEVLKTNRPSYGDKGREVAVKNDFIKVEREFVRYE
jgi:hypothetical protein